VLVEPVTMKQLLLKLYELTPGGNGHPPAEAAE
jgi:hypothetical protein